MKTYQIPESNLSTLQFRMAKLVRRCTRIKVEPPVLTVGTFEDIPYKNDAGFDRIRRVYDVTLESAGRPKIDGYEFIGVLSPVSDESGKVLGNVLRAVPGASVTVEQKFRAAADYCDHCKTSRRRLETFIITDGTTQRQIGRNCLANYLGLTNPDTLATIAEILIDADELAGMAEGEGESFGGRVQERVSLDEVLLVAASAIRLYGWLSNKSAQEFEKTSTSSRVRDWVFGGPRTREQFEHKLVANDEDKTLAANTYEWLQTLPTDSQDDYRYNLALLAKSVSVTGKNFGIAVSAINAYSKEKEFEIRRNARIEADSKSEFMGAVGERITIENALILYTTTFETKYGVTHFFKFKAGDNVLVYFASNPMWEQGETIPVMTARIKAHENRVDNYNPQGVKQTIITRATLPKPPKPELTPEQKIAKKAIAKLRKVQRTLPNHGPSVIEQEQTGQDYNDYVAWSTVNSLIWDIQKEAKI